MSVQLTEQVTVAAPGEDVDAPIVVRMVPDNGAAYAPGSPSTVAVIGLLQDLDLSGKRVLDFGTGTGVLALVAAALGAPEVVAYDYHQDMVRLAAANVEASGFDVAVVGEDPGWDCDIILANLGDVEAILPLVNRCDTLIASGRVKRQRLGGGRGVKPTYTRAMNDVATLLNAKGRAHQLDHFAEPGEDGEHQWAVIRG